MQKNLNDLPIKTLNLMFKSWTKEHYANIFSSCAQKNRKKIFIEIHKKSNNNYNNFLNLLRQYLQFIFSNEAKNSYDDSTYFYSEYTFLFNIFKQEIENNFDKIANSEDFSSILNQIKNITYFSNDEILKMYNLLSSVDIKNIYNLTIAEIYESTLLFFIDELNKSNININLNSSSIINYKNKSKSKLKLKEAEVLLKHIELLNKQDQSIYIEYLCKKYSSVYKSIPNHYLLIYLLDNPNSCIFNEKNILKDSLSKYLSNELNCTEQNIEYIFSKLTNIEYIYNENIDKNLNSNKFKVIREDTIKYYLLNHIRNNKSIDYTKKYLDNYYKNLYSFMVEHSKHKELIDILYTICDVPYYLFPISKLIDLFIINIQIKDNKFYFDINNNDFENKIYCLHKYLYLTFDDIKNIDNMAYIHFNFDSIYLYKKNNSSSHILSNYEKKIWEYIYQYWIPSKKLLLNYDIYYGLNSKTEIINEISISYNKDNRLYTFAKNDCKTSYRYVVYLMIYQIAFNSLYFINTEKTLILNEDFRENIEKYYSNKFYTAYSYNNKNEQMDNIKKFYRYLLLIELDNFNLKNSIHFCNFIKNVCFTHLEEYEKIDYSEFVKIKEMISSYYFFIKVKNKFISELPEYSNIINTYINSTSDIKFHYLEFYDFLKSLLE